MSPLAPIYAKLPHAGTMCLLDQVLDWDQGSILCASDSHHSPDNPLRRAGALASAHAVEYAAQAAAVHGVLSSVIDAGPVLLLAAVRDLHLAVDRLDTLPGPILVSARQQARSGPNAIYAFALAVGTAECAGGSLTLMQGAGSDG